METFEESKQKIISEITSDEPDVRHSYLERYKSQVDEFGTGMAKAILAWRDLDAGSEKEEARAYASALVYCAITLHIQSMRLFLSGHQVAAGNLSRQVIEAIALALLCSSKQLTVLKCFIDDKYTSNPVTDLLNHYAKLGVKKDSIKVLKKAQKFYNKFSHPTKMTIAVVTPFSEEGLYVGASFDEGKIAEYDKEVSGRISLAGVFANFVEAVKANVTKW
ncbi:MAG: hypothetical protein M0P72_08750 [Metallibacterium scheffleri]|uniref:hypothetical protein n=1 Tax=Metallibacterium scheffleri TaxID=993689 RepID=UPI0026EA8082|nr:hypothetical protein [Metallibacterium scheffleri]MCK9367222.1 hypothetical protein [Metallibacterium scheffleri]